MGLTLGNQGRLQGQMADYQPGKRRFQEEAHSWVPLEYAIEFHTSGGFYIRENHSSDAKYLAYVYHTDDDDTDLSGLAYCYPNGQTFKIVTGEWVDKGGSPPQQFNAWHYEHMGFMFDNPKSREYWYGVGPSMAFEEQKTNELTWEDFDNEVESVQ